MRLAGWLAFIGCWSPSIALAQPNPEPDGSRSTPATSTSTSTSTPTPTPTPSPRPPGHYLHDGFYLRFALGPAFLHLPGTAPSGTITLSGGGLGEILAIGGTIPEGVVIAGAASAVGSNTAVIGNYGVLVDWFPDPKEGAHVGSLFGLGGVVVPAPLTGETLRGFGWGMTFFGGYDFWITPQCSIGFAAVATATTPAAMRDSNGNASGYKFEALWFGLLASILYH